MPEIKELFIYPLKSAQGISLDQMEIDKSGPCHDREWMLVNKNFSFISQRTHPQLGLFKTRLQEDCLEIESPAGEVLKLSLDDWGEPDQRDAKIFGKDVKIRVYGQPVNSFFEDHLKSEVLLARTPKEKPRRTSGNHGPVSPLNFSDGYPFLLTSLASLEDLNSRLTEPVTMTRFRPNIVIEGATSGEEDQWKEFKIGSIPFLSVKACARCSIINIKPGTLESDKEVTQALKSYRKDGNAILFGQNLTHLSIGSIRRGDQLQDIVRKES